MNDSKAKALVDWRSMTRLAGIDLPNKDTVSYALTHIRGIGWTLSRKILNEVGIEEQKRVGSLTADEVAKLADAIEGYTTEGDLARLVETNIRRLQAIGAYRGLRHSRNLPVRGQRTRSNARTKRGKRKTVGAFKKEELSKTSRATKEEA